MDIITAIDSFKGSMTSQAANQAVKKALPQHNVTSFSIADGGEGTVDAFVSLEEGKIIEQSMTGINGKQTTGKWGFLEADKTAVIEVAEGAGLIYAREEALHPKNHTSYGVGEQIMQALDYGAETIILGLGGSGTVDGGMGMLEALGVVFKDDEGEKLPTLPVQLKNVKEIDTSALDSRIQSVNWLLASDVSNELCGKEGAVYIFGEQKGYTKDELKAADEELATYAKLVSKVTGKDESKTKGAGAAGGIGFAALSFFPCTFKSGFSLLAERGNLKEKIKKADLVITGEGKFDTQSLSGKAPIGVSRLAKEVGVPAILFAGNIADELISLEEENILATIPIVDAPMTLKDAMEKGPILLETAVKRTFNLLKK